jgi:hypothetical protein
MKQRLLSLAALLVAWSGHAAAEAPRKGVITPRTWAPERLQGPPLAGSAPAASARKAEKQAPPSVELLVLHATHGKPELDPRISDLDELKKPPFSSYERYRLIDSAKLPLVKGTPKTRRLPNGRVLKTELAGVVEGDVVRLVASINQPGAEDFLPLLEVKANVGQRFIVAGQRYKSGILVLVLRVVR